MKEIYMTSKIRNSAICGFHLFLLVFSLALMPVSSWAEVSFVNITSFGDDVFHGGLKIEDFNKDGIGDLAVINRYKTAEDIDHIAVLLGKGDGSFLPVAEYPAGYEPARMITGDFNNDGTVDIVTCNYDNTLKSFLGYSDGSFMPYTTAVSIPDACNRLATADFNNDENVDIVQSNYSQGGNDPSLFIFMGNGNATFTVYTSVYDDLAMETTVHAADFNHDGNADLAVSYPWFSKIGIFPGIGDGSFGETQFYDFSPWGLYANNFSIEDINFDGSPDLVGLPNHVTGKANTLINDGFGLFSTVTWTNLSTISPGAMVTDDFNCDGRHDMAVSGRDTVDSLKKLFIYTGSGDGTFQFDSSYILTGTDILGTHSDLLTTGDLNNDGIADIAIKAIMHRMVNVYLNTTPPETNYCSTIPDIKANGSDEPLVINQGDTVDLTVSLDPGFAAGVDSDSWVYGVSETMGTYWYQLGTGWVASETPIAAYQGPLATVTDLNILSISTLPAGVYDVYFQVDERNGIKEGARTDSIHVTIQ